jgi:hypothetical protein
VVLAVLVALVALVVLMVLVVLAGATTPLVFPGPLMTCEPGIMPVPPPM